MTEQRKLAVIAVRNDISVAVPNMADVLDLVLYGPSSIARYFRESAEDHFILSPIDFFGPYDVVLPMAPSNRSTGIEIARTAARNAGVDLGPYDGTIVFAFPGTGYDGGADGIGPGSAVFLPVTSDFAFFCHEIGHVLGFDHSYGIWTTGADWSNDGIDQLYPVYGDPYDLMSSATFGASDPKTQRPATDVPAAYPSWAYAPPHLSRALLHYTRPQALDDHAKAVHLHEGAGEPFTTLYPVGHGGDGTPELLVFHPSDEDAGARGRVYVEYRQPFDHNWASRWDKGLADVNEPGARDRCGVIVHTVVDQPGITPGPVVWYTGRILFPSPDTDAMVDTPHGPVHVTVSSEFAQSTRPGYVRVRVSRSSTPGLTVRTADADAVSITSSVRRTHPGWEWAGEFTYETRDTTRTTTYTPVSVGIGGNTPIDAESDVVVSWFVGGTQVFGATASVSATTTDGRTITLEATLSATTGVLTLTNHPSDGDVNVTITARASDHAGTQQAFATTSYTVAGRSEGWGEDWDCFQEFWYRITHPIPRDNLDPRPDPGDPLDAIARLQLELVREAYALLRQANPVVAQQLGPVMADQERILQARR